MNTKKKTGIAAIALVALASLGVGSAALAQTKAPAQSPAPATVQQPAQQPEATTPEADNGQSGEQFESQSEADDATEAPEAKDATEAPEAKDATEAPEAQDATEAPEANDGTDQGKDEQSPSYTSSLTAPQGNDTGTETKDDEAAEAASLATTQGLINEQAAKDAALTAFPGGTVQKVELDNENGSIVYSVELTDSAGASFDVKVDAGNGQILQQQAGGADESGEEAGEH